MTKAYAGPRALKTLMICAAMALAGWAGTATAHEGHDHDADDKATQSADPSMGERVGDVYPLATCIVSGEPLDSMDSQVIHLHEGREIRFCCSQCQEQFQADPAKHLKKLDAAIIEQQLASYPLDTCPISGEKLGAMGEPVNLVVGNRLVRLCCSGCERSVNADPGKTIAKLNAAAGEAQRAGYPTDTCVVSGDKLGSMGDPVELVFAGRLVRLCCKGCVEDFEADPHTYLKKLDAATATAAAE
jgi:YHS domain-containing protein